MRRVMIAAVAVSIVLAGCGTAGEPGTSTSPTTAAPTTSAVESPSPPAAPATPADGGMVGPWVADSAGLKVSVAFDLAAAAATTQAAELCRKAMKGDPVVWVLIQVENASGSAATVSAPTVVTGDGRQVSTDNAVTTIGDWYVDAPDSKAREDCVATAQAVAESQIESGTQPGATLLALHSLPADVETVKLVTAGGPAGPLEFVYTP